MKCLCLFLSKLRSRYFFALLLGLICLGYCLKTSLWSSNFIMITLQLLIVTSFIGKQLYNLALLKYHLKFLIVFSSVCLDPSSRAERRNVSAGENSIGIGRVFLRRDSFLQNWWVLQVVLKLHRKTKTGIVADHIFAQIPGGGVGVGGRGFRTKLLRGLLFWGLLHFY